MDKGLVSVIMPAYNVEPYIQDAIESVIKQTYTYWELIVVDDGSTDKTLAIIKALSEKDSRIKYLSQNRGRQGKARNHAITNSHGKYIAFLDADDLWEPNKLQLQTDLLESRPDIDLVFTRGYNLLPDGSSTEINIAVKEWTWDTNNGELITANQLPILSVMAKRSAIESVGMFTEIPEIQNAEDYHLWIRMLKQGRFLSIADRLFHYRIHPGQVTYQNSNTVMAITNCLFNLAITGAISNNNKSLKERLKWLIFQSTNLRYYIKMLKKVYSNKASLLSVLLMMNNFFPNSKLIKKLAFHTI
jgi:teichuronic acid biosynthesis glycosyltransferase TuaG